MASREGRPTPRGLTNSTAIAKSHLEPPLLIARSFPAFLYTAIETLQLWLRHKASETFSVIIPSVEDIKSEVAIYFLSRAASMK